MRLEGRLSGHFLTRVVLLVGGLGLVFLLWVGGLALSAYQTREAVAPSADILRTAVTDTRVTSDTVVLGADTIAAARKAGYWVQVLDESGDEIAQSARPADAPVHYTPGGLVLARQKPATVGMAKISTWVETIDSRELTFILGRSVEESPSGPQVYLGGDAPVSQPRLWMLMVALLAERLLSSAPRGSLAEHWRDRWCT
jgi:hypothetical protein